MRVLDDWLLTPQRAAIHLPTATAVAADLHLGYDRVRRRGGEAVPVRPVAHELCPLAAALAENGVRRLVVAGDLFEDGRCQREELVGELQAWLRETGVELVGVAPGNHDGGLGGSGLPVFPDGVVLGRWRVVHGDKAAPDGPFVQGHEHPWMRWRRGVEGPCYLVGEGRLVLPASSADAAGVNVLGKQCWADYRCCVAAGDRVLDFGPVGGLGRA
jgi:metallophosphoesterase superfamily enzyme